jgi:hypothetical protein
MKPLFIGLIFVAATASASAQVAMPILPQIFGSSASDRVAIFGCVIGGGTSAGLTTMMNPVIVPSTVVPGSVASIAAKPIIIPQATLPVPAYEPQSWPTAPTIGTTSPSPVGTTGTSGTFSIGPVEVTGTMAPVTPEIIPAPSATGFQEFHVQSVMPSTGSSTKTSALTA